MTSVENKATVTKCSLMSLIIDINITIKSKLVIKIIVLIKTNAFTYDTVQNYR